MHPVCRRFLARPADGPAAPRRFGAFNASRSSPGAFFAETPAAAAAPGGLNAVCARFLGEGVACPPPVRLRASGRVAVSVCEPPGRAPSAPVAPGAAVARETSAAAAAATTAAVLPVSGVRVVWDVREAGRRGPADAG
jgi:hypothetical protein